MHKVWNLRLGSICTQIWNLKLGSSCTQILESQIVLQLYTSSGGLKLGFSYIPILEVTKLGLQLYTKSGLMSWAPVVHNSWNPKLGLDCTHVLESQTGLQLYTNSDIIGLQLHMNSRLSNWISAIHRFWNPELVSNCTHVLES